MLATLRAYQSARRAAALQSRMAGPLAFALGVEPRRRRRPLARRMRDRLTIESAFHFALLAIVAAVAVSDSVGGMAARISYLVPLYWAGLVDAATVDAAARWFLIPSIV